MYCDLFVIFYVLGMKKDLKRMWISVDRRGISCRHPGAETWPSVLPLVRSGIGKDRMFSGLGNLQSVPFQHPSLCIQTLLLFPLSGLICMAMREQVVSFYDPMAFQLKGRRERGGAAVERECAGLAGEYFHEGRC
jgi:hypothetical protein